MIAPHATPQAHPQSPEGVDDAGERRALRDLYLAEMWPVCREVPADVRAGWHAVDDANKRIYERHTAATRAAAA